MTILHGNPSAAFADIFHGCQLVLAHVAVVHLRCSTKAAFGFVTARIAEMSRFIGNRTTVFACVCHDSLLSSDLVFLIRIVYHRLSNIRPYLRKSSGRHEYRSFNSRAAAIASKFKSFGQFYGDEKKSPRIGNPMAIVKKPEVHLEVVIELFIQLR
jgi:hypothetical protein